MIEEKIIGIGVVGVRKLELITEYGEKIIEEDVPLNDPITYLLKIGYNLHIGIPLGINSCDKEANDREYLEVFLEVLLSLNTSFKERLEEKEMEYRPPLRLI